jgi:hypothetical protein
MNIMAVLLKWMTGVFQWQPRYDLQFQIRPGRRDASCENDVCG